MRIAKCQNHFFTKRRSYLMVFVFVIMVLFKTTYFFVPVFRDGIKMNSTSFQHTLPVRRSPAFTYPKWIVVTTINKPTEQIKRLSEIPGWKLLVVADKKTTANWTHTNTIILTTKTQLSLNYAITKFLPWNAYTRKVIGYLYAIQHGAEFIYDTDDDIAPNDVEDFKKHFDLTKRTRGLIAETKEITLNPYSHFGQPKVWPRGYPFEYIGQISNNTYTACQMMTPLVQQGLVSGDPDVDANFRLTRKSTLNIRFDGAAPPLILPEFVFAPFNSRNTLFHYKAFWAMVLPISVEFCVTDIWRGYWAQPLLWAIGTHLGFYSNYAIQRRSPHLYLRDFGEEDQLYKQAGTLVNFLKDWNCSKSILYDCMVELTILMGEKKFWSLREVQVMEAWISDLKSIGYRFPILQTRSSTCVDGKLQSFAIFKGVEKKAGRKLPTYRIPLREFCNLSISGSRKSLQPIEFDSTLLVVTFNWPHYENIWLLDSIYRPHYPNMVYCGNFYNSSTHGRLLASENFTSANIRGYSFILANVTKGYFAYECALRAIDMNYAVSGYLFVADDVLFNIWNNRNLSAKQVWSPGTYTIYAGRSDNDWDWWESIFGVNATESAMAQIYNSSANVLIKFRTQREGNGYNASTLLSANSDIFYFPKIKEEMFYEVGSIMRDNKVFLEIAVPILMSGISATQNTHFLNGNYIWHKNRSNPFKFFETPNSFLHPVKLKKVISNRTLRAEYCRHYVTKVLEFGETTRWAKVKRLGLRKSEEGESEDTKNESRI